MNTGRQARALAQAPAFAWPGTDLRRWGVHLALFGVCVAAGLLLTAPRLESMRLRYDLSELDGQREGVASEVSRLELELATLSSPRRIEGLAKGMGFVYPSGDSVAVLDE